MDPLFTVEELNPNLLKKVPNLKRALQLRDQAAAIAKYLVSCRIAGQILKEDDYKDCINIQDPGTLSLVELCLIKLGAYGKSLRSQMNIGIAHVFGRSNPNDQNDKNAGCPLCSARAFICEACRSEDIIYPFQPE